MAENPKSSLRITIPASKAKASSSLSSADPMEDQPSRRKRKVPTRYQDSGDYEDDDLVAAAEPEKKVARTSTAGRTRRQSTTSEPPAVPSASNLFDDEDVEDARAPAARVESEHDDDAHSDHSARHSSPVRTKTKTPKSAKGKAPPVESVSTTKKKGRANKRAVVVTDSEEEEAYMDTAVDALAEETEDEYVSEEEEKPVKKGKGKAKPPAKQAKAPPKRKAAEAAETTKGKGKAIKKPHAVSASKHEEPIIDVVGGSSPLEPPAGLAKSTSGSASKQESTTTASAPAAVVPTPVLKKKLPTINKVKGATTSGLSTPTTPTPVPKKPTATHLDIREDALKKTDVNLFDSSVYNQLFAKPKAGASASSARPDNEERRKEIERQREEAKAKRKAEAAHSFDLQAQAEKIARFEETLKNTQSLYPNMVAGRWKQSFEEVRRLQREQEMWAKDNAAREEGEVM